MDWVVGWLSDCYHWAMAEKYARPGVAVALLCLIACTSGTAQTPAGSAKSSTTNATLTAVPGLKVAHFTYRERPTGCTVVIAENGVTAGVDVRGAAPGTRETDLLDPV